eukprot:4301322-Amphidinium_carterae.1
MPQKAEKMITADANMTRLKYPGSIAHLQNPRMSQAHSMQSCCTQAYEESNDRGGHIAHEAGEALALMATPQPPKRCNVADFQPCARSRSLVAASLWLLTK